MGRISIIAAALMLGAAGPARANDLDDSILAQSQRCVHRYVWSMRPLLRYTVRELIDNATAQCEPMLLSYAKQFHPDADFKKLHSMVVEAAGREIEDYDEQDEPAGAFKK
jgi:hypothetical protein